jgi:hypothetical protein
MLLQLISIPRAHFHIIPRSLQAYKFMQLAIAMLVDLDMGNDADAVILSSMEPPVRVLRSGYDLAPTLCMSAAAARASIGCFYLSSV